MKKTYSYDETISLKGKGLLLVDAFGEDAEMFSFEKEVNRFGEGLNQAEFANAESPYYPLVPSYICPLALQFPTRQQVIEDYQKRDSIAIGELIVLQHLGYSLKTTSGRFVNCVDSELEYVYLWGEQEEIILLATSAPSEAEELPVVGGLIQFNNSVYIPEAVPHFSYGEIIEELEGRFEDRVKSYVTGETYEVEAEAFYFAKEEVDLLYL